ncbi:hypothetical protein GCM10027294_26090 [Marinactinospora endophytica]
MITEIEDCENGLTPALWRLVQRSRAEAPRRFVLWGVSENGDFTDPLYWGLEFPGGGAICANAGGAYARCASAERTLNMLSLARPLTLVWIDRAVSTPSGE